MNNENIINGQKVILRPINEYDTGLIINWRNSDEVKNNFIFQDDLTEEIHRKWLNDVVGTGKAIQYIIMNRENELPVGSVYFRDINIDNKSAEYGVFIGEACSRCCGFGKETALLFCKYGFEVIGLKHIFLRVFVDNISAVNCYFSAGFKIGEMVALKQKDKSRWMYIMHKRM